jgi:hypothetical protein
VANNILLGSATGVLAEDELPVESIPLQVTMSNLVYKRNWERAEQLALQLRSRVFSALNLLEGEYHNCLREEELHKELCEDRIETGNKMLAALRNKAFKKKLEDIGSLNDFKAAAKKLKSSCAKPDRKFRIFRPISRRSQYVVAIGYTGFWAGFHANFNIHLDKFVPKPPTSSDILKMTKMIQKEQTNISKNLRKLYFVTGKGNRDAMSTTSLNILRLQEINLQLLSTLCASVCGITRSILNGNIDGDIKKVGRIDILAGKMARSWAFLTVFALYVSYLALLPTRVSTFQQVTNNARRLPFNPKNKKFQIASPKELWRQGKKYNGKYIQLNGFVRNITKRRTKGGMFLNIFEVYQPSVEEFVKVVVIFEEMNRRGLVNTASVQLYGTWRQKSKIANIPVFQLERLKTFELKNRYGFNYILEKIRPWFDYFPNSYHAYWSVRPQKAKSNIEGPLTGAGELVFIEPFSSLTGDR